MTAKKIFKGIGKGLLFLLILITAALIVTSAVYHIKKSANLKELKNKGCCELVSVGDHSLNLFSCGNEQGRHTVVALAGLGDGEMSIGWRLMTADIEKDNRLIFLDRAGYGLSDDTDMDMTAENVVEDYRKALLQAEIKGPYVLMGHSLGGLYATYWESTYPDEIEAVIFLDGSICYEIPEEEHIDSTFSADLSLAAEKLGLMPFIIKSQYGRFLEKISEDRRENALYMMCATAGTSAFKSEMTNGDRNYDFVWKNTVTNDIPKYYISASAAYRTKQEYIEDGVSAKSLENVYFLPDKNMTKDEMYSKALEKIEELRNDLFYPYIEKLGNCQVAELHGDHTIFLHKPEECSRLIKGFIDSLN